jgi:hypothetical protein
MLSGFSREYLRSSVRPGALTPITQTCAPPSSEFGNRFLYPARCLLVNIWNRFHPAVAFPFRVLLALVGQANP